MKIYVFYGSFFYSFNKLSHFSVTLFLCVIDYSFVAHARGVLIIINPQCNGAITQC